MPMPKADRHRGWLVGLLAAGLVGLLTMLFALFLQAGFRRTIAVPLIQTYMRLRFFLALLPQYLVWIVPVLGMAVLLLASYLRALQTLPQGGAQPTIRQPEPDPLLALAVTISHARRRPFYRRMIIRKLGKTAVRIIAKREGLSLSKARKRFELGDWCDNRAVRDLFISARDDERLSGIHDFDRRLDEAISVLEKLEQGV